MHAFALVGEGGGSLSNLTISANTSNYNIFTAAGSPTTPVHITLTIASGVIVNDAARSGQALRTGIFPAGSTILIVNNGFIEGFGGNGDGGAGGDAIRLDYAATIDNTNGYVRAGGGGGAIGADTADCGGGGGGGGQGNPGGSAGAGSNAPFFPGDDGTAGSRTSPGGGGAGADFGGGAEFGGGGGAGGGWGVPGDSSSPSSDGARIGGGAAGAAVRKHGFSLTWIGGNNSTQVKGAQV